MAEACPERHLCFPRRDDSINRDNDWMEGYMDDLFRFLQDLEYPLTMLPLHEIEVR